jgi:hypothetical protein
MTVENNGTQPEEIVLDFETGIEHPPEKPYTADEIRVFRAPKNTPRMTVKDERSYIRVRPVQASPVSFPDKYISLLDVKNEEVAFIEDVSKLDDISREVIREELARRYLKAEIIRVASIQMEFGVTYWQVETDRGARDFVTRGHENTYWVTDTRLLLTDVDGNRFEIGDYLKLDEQSIKLIESFV